MYGGTDEVVSSDGSLFDGTGADVSSGGRGRGNGGGNERSRCRLPSVSVPRVNQLEMPCAISDRVDRPPVRTCDGACASTEVAPRARKNRVIATAFRRVTRTTFPVKPPNRHTLSGHHAMSELSPQCTPQRTSPARPFRPNCLAKRTSSLRSVMSVFGGKADIEI